MDFNKENILTEIKKLKASAWSDCRIEISGVAFDVADVVIDYLNILERKIEDLNDGKLTPEEIDFWNDMDDTGI